MEKVFPIMMILVLGLNGLWYWIKLTLKENGYPVSWFWSHFSDIPNMYKLAKSTDKPKKKRKYYLMAIGLTVGVIAFPIVFFYSSSLNNFALRNLQFRSSNPGFAI